MPKRQTSKSRRRTRPNVLEVRVMSPRIAWFGFLRFLGGAMKVALLLAVVVGLGWGVWQGIRHAFYKNPDFRLQVIDLNPNPAIDELGVTEAAGIDLSASLFDVDVEQVAARLKSLPSIQDARAERHLPGKLLVRVVARAPKAWVSLSEGDPGGVRAAGGMLVDADGFAYPCPELQLEAALKLPVVVLPADGGQPLRPGKLEHRELAHCFRLLDSAVEADAAAAQWIDSMKQVNAWSLRLVTREGTSATFALGDHPRQIASLRAAMDHASRKGYSIGTINLIPKHNLPITLRGDAPAPRAVPVAEPAPGDLREERRTRDLRNLLDRN